jgi:broad specificity phosphatase PhoE
VSTLFFIRHGQASFGRANYDRLSERGYEQARVLAEHLLGGQAFDRIYTGTLQRQTETARMLTDLYREKKIPLPTVRQSEAFNEYGSETVCRALIPELLKEDPGLEPMVAAMFEDNRSFQTVFETVMQRWVAGAYSTPGLERWETFKLQVNAALDGILAADGRGRRVAVFTSGGPIAVSVQRALSLSDETCLQVSWQVANASITRFKCTPDRIMLATFNEHAHLEQADDGLVTYR